MSSEHKISVLTIGSEILDGRVQDTNAAWLAAALDSRGLSTAHFLSCDDVISDIRSALAFLLERSKAVVISGGLGPTTDDLTRESIAEFFSRGLAEDAESLERMKRIFEKRGRKFESTNAKQALFPEGGQIIKNPRGTAPGFSLTAMYNGAEKHIFALPGVPSEFYAMAEESVIPAICAVFKNAGAVRGIKMRIFGLPESAVGARVEECRPDRAIKISYRASFPEIHVILKSSDPAIDLAATGGRIAEGIGQEYIFSNDINKGLEQILHDLLIQKKVSLSAAESCTGGLVAGLVTNNPGSSACFTGGVVSYSNRSKSELLSVAPDIIEKHGAVSHEVARAMAAGCREKFGSDLAVSVTGIAGPDGGTEEKPVGLFFVGLADRSQSRSFRYFYPSSREYVRRYAAFMALDTVRRSVLGLPPHPEYDGKK